MIVDVSGRRPIFILQDAAAGAMGVLFGVPGDALQRIDTAEPHIEALVAELVDCPGESLGHLPFAGDPDLPEGSRRAGQHRKTAKPLQQRRPRVVA